MGQRKGEEACTSVMISISSYQIPSYGTNKSKREIRNEHALQIYFRHIIDWRFCFWYIIQYFHDSHDVGPVLQPQPDFYTFTITGDRPSLLLMASDGIWHVMSNNEVCFRLDDRTDKSLGPSCNTEGSRRCSRRFDV